MLCQSVVVLFFSAAFFFAVGCIGLLALAYLASLRPDRAALARDLRWLEKALPLEVYREAEFDSADVVEYYEQTTFRDYRLLELATGCDAMHTELAQKTRLPYRPGQLQQLLYVIAHAGSAKTVLEVGSGKGSNSVFLAALLPHVRFFAVDLVPAHVRHASRAAREAGLDNVAFFLGDACAPPEALAALEFDLVFGIESLCHMDNPEKMSDFLGPAGPRLSAGGRLVIVDGFRTGRFDELEADVREAMNLAESGFRIGRMPSKGDWSALASGGGLRLVQDTDLTPEALEFWTRGWKAARLLTVFPGLVRWYLGGGGRSGCKRRRRETGANFVAVLMTAYAMALGAAEYGVLAFVKD
jgi:predicted O-methyltransferase YrrM